MAPTFLFRFQETVLKILPKPSQLPLRGFHPLRPLVPEKFKFPRSGLKVVFNTTSPTHYWWDSVCPIPLSIAFTSGISFDFFSCRY